MQLLSHPFTTVASAGEGGEHVRLPVWLAWAIQPQAFAARRIELVWTAAWAALAVAIAAADVVAGPRTIGAGALAVLPVLAASWMLGGRALVAVIALSVALVVGMTIAGVLTPAALVARMVALLLVAVLGRTAALGTGEVRRARQHEVSTLLHAAHLLARAVDQPGVAAEVVEVAAGALAPGAGTGGPAAALVAVEREGATLVARRGEADGAPPSVHVPLGRLPAVFQRVLTSTRAGVASASDLEPLLGSVEGTSSWAIAGVQIESEPFGVLAVAHEEAADVRPGDLRLLEGVARVAGQALGASRRHAELDQLRRRLQRSMELALDVARTLAPDQVNASILLRVTETVGADQAALARVDGTDLVVEATYRAVPRPSVTRVGRQFPPESVEGLPELAAALATGQPVIGALRPRVGGEELAAALPSAPHTVTFPFAVGGRTACLLVLSRHGGRQFDSADLAQLEPMADVALLALRNAHLHADVERARRDASTWSGRLQLAIEAAEEIGSSGELSEVVDRMLRRAVAVVHADRGRISRLEGDWLVLEHDDDPASGDAASGARWPLAENRLAAEAIASRRAVRSPAGAAQPEQEHLVECPLVVEREVVGLLQLARRRDQPFTEADLLTLQPFATLAALLLRNARLLAEARQVGQAKSAFLNLAAHELRTPLAVIKGYLSLLEDGTYPVPRETREEAVATLLAKAQELESLVEALLTTARLEVGTLPRAEGELDACEVVQDAVARIRPRARLEGARIDVRLPEGDHVARADRAHVGRILDNLLNNALTYSGRPARVTVQVRAGDAVELVVRDHGLGIPVEHHQRVFERFHRVDGGVSAFSPGLGLGLAISRELAEINGGSLVLERSTPGDGSVFVLRLPAVARQPVPS